MERTRGRGWVGVLFAVLAWVPWLLGASGAESFRTEAERLRFLQRLRFVSEAPMRRVKEQITPQKLCLEHDWTPVGQPWTVGPAPYEVSWNTAGQVASFPKLFRVTPSLSGRQGTVLVLVPDDYEPTPNIRGAGGVALRHGELVVAHLRALLDSTTLFTSAGQAGSVVFQPKQGARQVVIRKIGVGAPSLTTLIPGGLLDTTRLVKELEAVAAWAGRDAQGELHVILNMSFVVLPCLISADYRLSDGHRTPGSPSEKAGKEWSFRFYLEQLMQRNTQGRPPAEAARIRADIAEVISTLPDDNLLAQAIRGVLKVPEGRGASVAVAASGNLGLPYPLAPASRPEVLGVGAVDWAAVTGFAQVDDGNPAHRRLSWSNPADVYTVGGRYGLNRAVLNAFCPSNCVLPVGAMTRDVLSYSGTSFATPSVTAYLALTIGKTGCFTGSGTRVRWPGSAAPVGKWTLSAPSRPVFKGGPGGVLAGGC